MDSCIFMATGGATYLSVTTSMYAPEPQDWALARAASSSAHVVTRAHVLVVLYRVPGALFAHLVSDGPERVQGATLFLGVHVAGGARRARFCSADGQDVRIPMNPSGSSVSTVLPSFRGYAVLSLAI